jgi:hypothetical protein
MLFQRCIYRQLILLKKIIAAGRLLVEFIFEEDCMAEYTLGVSLLLLLLRPLGPQDIRETLCFTSVS